MDNIAICIFYNYKPVLRQSSASIQKKHLCKQIYANNVSRNKKCSLSTENEAM